MCTHTFESLLAVLGQGGVEFILVDGLAVVGILGATFDLDILREPRAATGRAA